MPVQAISNRDNFSDTLTMGVGGAGIGAGVGYLLKPSVDSFTKSATQLAVQNVSADISTLTNAIKEAKKNGVSNISKSTLELLGNRKFNNIKEMQTLLGSLVQDKIVFEDGKVYEKALKRLSKNTKKDSQLVNNAKKVLTQRLNTTKKEMSEVKDTLISLLKPSGATPNQEIANTIMRQAKYNNTIKGGAIGAAIAISLFTLGLMLKPKQKYIIIQEEEKTV